MAMDRQSFIFIFVMIILLSYPSDYELAHSEKDKETLLYFQLFLSTSRDVLANSTYKHGYGNLTGFKLSYKDSIDGHNALEWPLHKYSSKNPWVEREKYSILPNSISDDLKTWWGTEPVDESNAESSAYLLNITGTSYGDYSTSKTDLKPYFFELEKPFVEYYERLTQEKYDDEQERYANDPENNPPPEKEHDKKKIGDEMNAKGLVLITLRSLGYNFENQELQKFIKGPEDEVRHAVLVRVLLEFKDYPEIQHDEFETVGIYFQTTGSLVTSTATAKFLGIHGLPHMTFSESNFDVAKLLMTQLFNSSLSDDRNKLEKLNMYVSRSQEQCEMVSFLQLDKTSFLTQQLRDIDEELQNPIGRPIPNEHPQIVVKNGLFYSPDCAFVLRSSQETAGDLATVTNKERRAMFTHFLLVVMLQLYLYVREIRQISTPGQLSNVSSKTVLLLAYQDALMSLILLLYANLTDELYLILACITVILFVGVLIVVRFLVKVLCSQANERGISWWEIMRGSSPRENNESTNTTPPTETDQHILPAPVTAPQDQTAGPVSDDARFTNGVMATGISACIMSMFLVAGATTWRKSYRKAFEYAAYLLLNSYWFPQFIRNTIKNRRRAFLWLFICGSSILRMIPLFYLCMCRHNSFRHGYDSVLFGVLASWLAIQLLLLYIQTVLGARFWINERWLPKAYDYHPALSLSDLENGFASDILAGIKSHTITEAEPSSNSSGYIMCPVDCAICMSEVIVPVAPSDQKKDKKMANTQYMVTPCHHIFHTECLEDWMKYKLQCPVCRNSLPPV